MLYPLLKKKAFNAFQIYVPKKTGLHIISTYLSYPIQYKIQKAVKNIWSPLEHTANITRLSMNALKIDIILLGKVIDYLEIEF